jgi:pilus assembly protein CpaE
VAATISVVESASGQLAALARSSGLTVLTTTSHEDLAALERTARSPDVLLVDVRDQAGLRPEIGGYKRRNQRTGIVLVAAQLDPALMLEAMRAGVSEVVTDPVTPNELIAAIDRVVGQQAPEESASQIFAFIGAKGGVGTTTLAVNVAAALATDKTSNVLMVDMHITGHGDAALLLGVEPRFSVVDALDNVGRLDGAFLRGLVARAKVGLDLLASPDRPAIRIPEPGHIRDMLARLSTQYRTIVLDIPRSDLGLIDAIEPVTSMTLVVNQELPTVRRAAQIAALLRQRYGKDKVGTVVTRYDARADIGQEDIERVVGLPVWAVLPSDYRRAIAAANAGRPLMTENSSRLASSIKDFARKIGAVKLEERRPAKAAGRLAGLF